jgi:hypothetical protein
MPLDAALTSLAQAFKINLVSANPAARSFQVKLVPPGDSVTDRGLSVTDLETSTQIQQAPIDLTWRSKNVRFANTDISDVTTNGGLPINDLLALNVASVTSGATSPPGVPGLLGGLAGTLPIPIDVTGPVQVPVTLEVEWKIQDSAGHSIENVQWSLPSSSGTGGDILPQPADALGTLTLVFQLVLIEMDNPEALEGLTSGSLPTAAYSASAAIRLSANGVRTGWVNVPPVPLPVPAIPLPAIAIFCQDSNFKSKKLVMVPANSPLDQSSMSTAFSQLKDLLDPLAGTFSFLSLFLSSADLVSSLLNDTGNLTFMKTDQIPNLDDVDIGAHWYGGAAEDEFSSMIVLGVPGREMDCFNDQNFSTSQGEMNVVVGDELIVTIASLHSASPPTDPAGHIDIPYPPGDSRWSGPWPWHGITTFGDEFSSLRFAWKS